MSLWTRGKDGETYTFQYNGTTLASISETTGGLTLGDHTVDEGRIDLYDDDGSAYAGITASGVTTSTTYTLPSVDGDSGDFLSTNASGTLSWVAPGGGSSTVRAFLNYGRGPSISNETAYELTTANGSQNGQGYRLTSAVTAVNLSIQFNCSSRSSTQTVTLKLFKNGADTGDSIGVSVTSTGITGTTGSVNTSFVEGDTITCCVAVPSALTIIDTSAVVDVEFD